ncbi:hypothetical protein AB205_0040420 [Aquarana catesbeiana]|uniref:Uncharacterized protein n=1 Tax=Aquarana catesbeiana TaxID=8400 RepID=A0A2G9RI55_AQUCT|nr:hypothetical protein AB205_0040420 [Aquarana catesbeiana]
MTAPARRPEQTVSVYSCVLQLQHRRPEASPQTTICPNCALDRSHPPVPYHYYEKGRLDECTTYLMHERATRGAHRFITEKAVFSRWALKKHIHFLHPSWAT